MEQALALYLRMTSMPRTALLDELQDQVHSAGLQLQQIRRSSSSTLRSNALRSPETSDVSFEVCGRKMLQLTRQLHDELTITMNLLDGALPNPEQRPTSRLPLTSAMSTLDLPSPITPEPRWIRHGHRITKALRPRTCGHSQATRRMHFEWEELQRYDNRWEDELAYAELDLVSPAREAYLDSLMARTSAARPLIAWPGDSMPSHLKLPRSLKRGPRLSCWIPSAEYLAERAAMGWYSPGIDHRYHKGNEMSGDNGDAVEWNPESAACNY